LIQLAKTDLLVLDDWGMGMIDCMTRSDLLEIGDATIADAIPDRIMQRNHLLRLSGDSLRTERPKTTKK
jgi:DNA replication protein DnaC